MGLRGTVESIPAEQGGEPARLEQPDGPMMGSPKEAGKGKAGHSRAGASIRLALRPGTRLVRNWQGKSHVVEVQDECFAWNGEVYDSLSAVALAITGATVVWPQVLPAMSRKRCAIYTRKSTDEGLDQSFNSLDAQREACEAYIVSQRHEGWSLVRKAYDDGGFSGGSMERPALQLLLRDIQAGLVDVIVVYKIDRLTRSLADFAKMVDVFDARGVSFVSVTQQFNTTTSMGQAHPQRPPVIRPV